MAVTLASKPLPVWLKREHLTVWLKQTHAPKPLTVWFKHQLLTVWLKQTHATNVGPHLCKKTTQNYISRAPTLRTPKICHKARAAFI